MSGKAPWWIALGTVAVVPLFGYLEARTAAHSAARVAEIQRADSAQSKETTQAVFAATSDVTERLQRDITACHERVDKLAESIIELATNRRGRARTPSAVTEQRAIERPAQVRLPKSKSDVSANDPLAPALK